MCLLVCCSFICLVALKVAFQRNDNINESGKAPIFHTNKDKICPLYFFYLARHETALC